MAIDSFGKLHVRHGKGSRGSGPRERMVPLISSSGTPQPGPSGYGSSAADVRDWALVLQHGGPRSQPCNINTVRKYVRAAHPMLGEWPTRYDHLRKVTTGDVTAVADGLHGHLRRRTLGALRSLTRLCKRNDIIFADPAARVRIGNRDQPIIIPLRGNQIDEATRSATTPAARIALALAAVHAARPEGIRTLRLDDIDLGNWRLTIGSVTRPLDELTHRLLIDWLDYRRKRWPGKANPHLIINKQTASTTRAISDNPPSAPFRRRAATLEALRVDRQLDEALTHGPDPLHLAVVFGLDETTAIRYCAAARQILQIRAAGVTTFRTCETRPGWAPSSSRDGGALPLGPRIFAAPAASQRPVLFPRYHIPSAEVTVTRRQRGFTAGSPVRSSPGL
ncbi:hypothetical protein ACQP1G_25900 [Nocardia sp. CA-107356]|uniref:hypothetical protein n=1 Tax=Nocardia sp. CA-107356 TaxID=3239972 RepID=UPI003D8A253D